jgi:hypothetical protein
MLRTIFTASVTATILALTAQSAFAQLPEVDNEKAYTNVSSDATKATVVLKVDNKTGAVSILDGGANIANNQQAQDIAKNGNFVTLASDKVVTKEKSEYEESNSKTAFYVNARFGYFPNYHYGAYFGGYFNRFWAQPTYAYAYNDCNYYYYNNNNLGWNSGWDGSQGWGGQVPYYGNTGYGFGWNLPPVYNYAVYNGYGWGSTYFGGIGLGYGWGGYRGGYAWNYGRGGYGFGRGGGVSYGRGRR